MTGTDMVSYLRLEKEHFSLNILKYNYFNTIIINIIIVTIHFSISHKS